ncbi:ribbon-helix-helix domain-containing protein [Rickettsiella massiliensis]|uniref:ribbon-helix-helix domain-containing protein n=1 Tax=Rickettsiella massiliensis TaxID=676517 RepID=UPI00178C578C|nr:ribbon-helix-helix domain-containing protein [Rickettsiella massiliensis]
MVESNESKRKDRIGKKVITLYVNYEMWEKLKLIAVKEESNMNQLCKEGIEHIIKKYEK